MPEVDEGAGLSKNPFPEDDLGEGACLGAAFLGDSDLLANCEPTEPSKKPFLEDALVGEDCLGAAFLGDSLLLANWEPTELSKKPPPEEAFGGNDCLGAGAAFLGDSLLLANWEPTELSKKPPPPEEALVGEDCLGAAFSGALDPLVDWAATLLSKKDFVDPATKLPLSLMLSTIGQTKQRPDCCCCLTLQLPTVSPCGDNVEIETTLSMHTV